MELHNHTVFPAHLFRTIIDDHKLAAAVIVRVTYTVRDGVLEPAEEQAWGTSPGPWQTPYGEMESDDVFIRGGVDLFLFGHARAPGAEEVPWQEVRIQLGSFERKVIVFGERCWQRKGSELVASKPKPFRSMPLGLERAFGGTEKWDGLDVPFPDNPSGIGFYMTEESALGSPLPNLENPDCLVSTWEQRPRPAGLGICPLGYFARVSRGLELDDEGSVKRLNPLLFNAAFPEMIIDRVCPGQTLWLFGVSHAEPIRLVLPQVPVIVHLLFGEERIDRSPSIDQIGVEIDEQRVFISYRYPFRYVLHAGQRRLCELRPV